MRFTIRGAPANRRADSGGIGGVDEGHVEREMKTGCAVGRDADRVVHDAAQSALVDIAHGERAHAALAYVRFFELIHVAQSHNHGIARIDLRPVAIDIAQLRRTHARDAGERHAVDIPARAGVGRVHVGMRIEPDEPDRFAARAKIMAGAAYGPDRDRMIAAAPQRHAPAGERLFDAAGQRIARRRDLRQILRAGFALRPAFLLLHRNVAPVRYFIAQLRDSPVEIRDAHRGWTHVYPTTVLSEIERRADDRDAGMRHWC